MTFGNNVIFYLSYNDVGKLWKDYAGKHHHIIRAAALTTIRNCAPRVTQDEYLQRREYVQQLIHEALNDKFGMSIKLVLFISITQG